MEIPSLSTSTTGSYLGPGATVIPSRTPERRRSSAAKDVELAVYEFSRLPSELNDQYWDEEYSSEEEDEDEGDDSDSDDGPQGMEGVEAASIDKGKGREVEAKPQKSRAIKQRKVKVMPMIVMKKAGGFVFDQDLFCPQYMRSNYLLSPPFNPSEYSPSSSSSSSASFSSTPTGSSRFSYSGGFSFGGRRRQSGGCDWEPSNKDFEPEIVEIRLEGKEFVASPPQVKFSAPRPSY